MNVDAATFDALQAAFEESASPPRPVRWDAEEIELEATVQPPPGDGLWHAVLAMPGVLQAWLLVDDERILLDRIRPGVFETVIRCDAPRHLAVVLDGERGVVPGCAAYDVRADGLAGDARLLAPWPGPTPAPATIDVHPARVAISGRDADVTLTVRVDKQGEGPLGGELHVATARRRPPISVRLGEDERALEITLRVALADLPSAPRGMLRIWLNTNSRVANRRMDERQIPFVRPVLERDAVVIALDGSNRPSELLAVRRSDGAEVALQADVPAALAGRLAVDAMPHGVRFSALATPPRTLDDVVVIRDSLSGMIISVPVRIAGSEEKK